MVAGGFIPRTLLNSHGLRRVATLETQPGNMSHPLDDVCCARLPANSLAALAALRCERGLEVARADGWLWLRWEAGNERVLNSVMPLAGCSLFARRDDLWFMPGAALPSFAVPENLEYRPLYQVLFPAPLQPSPPPAHIIAPAPLRLSRDNRPRPTSALLCAPSALQAWADIIPAQRLRSLRSLVLERRLLVLGTGLPALAGSERFWGERVLVPLGYRPDPALAESALADAAGLDREEVLLLRDEGALVLTRTMLTPLTRAALHLTREELPA